MRRVKVKFDLDEWFVKYPDPDSLLQSKRPGLMNTARLHLGRDDSKSICTLACVRASKVYDWHRGSFANFALTYMDMAVREAVRSSNCMSKGRDWTRVPSIADGGFVDFDDYRERDESAKLAAIDLGDMRLLATYEEWEVLSRRYGIGRREETLREIAESEGVSREAIRLREAKAIKRLRSRVEDEFVHRQWRGKYEVVI